MKEIKIGNQIWMTENLNVEEFRNGDPIPHAQTLEEWKRLNKAGKPAWTYYDNDPKFGAKYGKLYNCNAVDDPRGLAPEGWHIPDQEEWEQLSEFFHDLESDTIEESFSKLPGGYYYFNGNMETLGAGFWWSSTECYPTTAWIYCLNDGGSEFTTFDDDKRNGFSVICLKGDPPENRVRRSQNVKSRNTSLLGLLFPMLFGAGNS